MPAFATELRGGDSRQCLIVLPFSPKTEFGRARAPVRVSVNDHAPFRTTVMIYGGQAMIGLRIDQQDEFGVAPGDRVQVRVERDDEPRTVELPDELATALRDAPDATAAYQRLSYTHRNEYARWVGSAKRPQTRLDRAARSVQMLRDGNSTPG
ncbi:MAG TPA: YdeI/OmpD-associated family protein [Jatrophihabitans sp.]|nr:YdeI/OmpD-associated family protein [Jatrophihabitans sp.]